MGQVRNAPDEKAEFVRRVYKIASSIPPGRVLTYGAIASLAGSPGRSRMVGKLMSRSPAHVPAHRVVNAAGRTAPGFLEQRAILEQEGVAFRANGCADLKRHLYKWQ